MQVDIFARRFFQKDSAGLGGAAVTPKQRGGLPLPPRYS
jgi:hypothetical protein